MAEIPGQEQRWVVGLDLRPASHGAINFALWLRAQTRGEPPRIDGLHIVEPLLLELPEAPSRVEVLADARKAADTALSVRGASEAFASVDVVSGDPVELLAAAGELAVTTGLILGRRAAEYELGLVRLGKVARRLLRRLGAPTFVVSPKLEAEHVGPGPVVCAVELDARSVELARYAEAFAARIGRDVRLVHVVEGGDPIGLPYLPEGTWDHIERLRRDEGSAALLAWRDEAGLSSYTSISQGPTVGRLLSAARELDACMILCGSRRLSLAARMWRASVGTALAAASHLPVGVIPEGA